MATESSTRGPGPSAPAVEGLGELRSLTTGDPGVCVAVLDGPVDRGHPALAGADLAEVAAGTGPGPRPARGAARGHGTHVAALIFGRPGGVAPGCRGLVVPVFRQGPGGALAPCSQVDLARAMALALAHGSDVINVSGGQASPTGEPHPLLAAALRDCEARGVLVVAAAGNDGCDCLHVPAAWPTALAVGASDGAGRPRGRSNWGRAYRAHGLLAPGPDTSSAAALVSGVAGLLLSLARRRGRAADGALVRRALLAGADGCPERDDSPNCRRLLAGLLNVRRATDFLLQGTNPMSDAALEPPALDPLAEAEPPASPAADPPAVRPSACGCASCAAAAAPQLVFALGRLGYDLASEARRDSLRQHMGPAADPADTAQLLGYLENNPWEAASVHWTLNYEQTPVYAVAPAGPFAAKAYARLRRFLAEHHGGETERVAVPGVLDGSVTLFNGQAVPVIRPELRGMASWTTAALADAVAGPEPAATAAAEERERRGRLAAAVRNHLDRLYYEMRNLGLDPRDRALNYAATNALNLGDVTAEAIRDEMELDAVHVERSPVCRPESDCWDVTLYFFYPGRQVQTVRRAYRFAVDVSDVVPVMVGPVRQWYVR
jgi:subtilisin family serine protease